MVESKRGAFLSQTQGTSPSGSLMLSRLAKVAASKTVAAVFRAVAAAMKRASGLKTPPRQPSKQLSGSWSSLDASHSLTSLRAEVSTRLLPPLSYTCRDVINSDEDE